MVVLVARIAEIGMLGLGPASARLRTIRDGSSTAELSLRVVYRQSGPGA
jgi:hypothetical protein